MKTLYQMMLDRARMDFSTTGDTTALDRLTDNRELVQDISDALEELLRALKEANND
jgi:hypothetical protein